QLSSPDQYSATVLFDLPQPGLTTNYRISTHFDMNKLSGATKDSCAVITTHITDAGWYLTQVCRNGSWEIDKVTSDQQNNLKQTALKSGSLGRSVSAVTMTMTSDNATYALAIDGKQVGSAKDTSLDQTGGVALTTVSPGPGTVIMSDFTYTALPKAAGSRSSVGHVAQIAH
ncbi:MAG TPA: hypothetical protein VKB76_01640, partial [Ktedonobacterales bacterium]|nr:hypothetical protein [Ktedonobacterales bacterium]